jgi:hypothetical protein
MWSSSSFATMVVERQRLPRPGFGQICGYGGLKLLLWISSGEHPQQIFCDGDLPSSC